MPQQTYLQLLQSKNPRFFMSQMSQICRQSQSDSLLPLSLSKIQSRSSKKTPFDVVFLVNQVQSRLRVCLCSGISATEKSSPSYFYDKFMLTTGQIYMIYLTPLAFKRDLGGFLTILVVLNLQKHSFSLVSSSEFMVLYLLGDSSELIFLEMAFFCSDMSSLSKLSVYFYRLSPEVSDEASLTIQFLYCWCSLIPANKVLFIMSFTLKSINKQNYNDSFEDNYLALMNKLKIIIIDMQIR